MAQDAFFREVKIDNLTINELKGALLSSVGAEKKNKRGKSNDDAIGKLTERVEDLLGDELKDELEKIRKVVEQVADCVCEISKKKESAQKKRKDDSTKKLEAAQKDLNSELAKGVDKVSDFSKVLEKSGERFRSAFNQIGKSFADDFKRWGTAINSRLGKLSNLNPLKFLWKNTDKDSKNVWDSIARGWDKSAGAMWRGMQSGWNITTSAMADLWDRSAGAMWRGVQRGWNATTTYVSDLWDRMTTKIGIGFEKTINGIGVAIDYISTPFKKLYNIIATPFKWFSDKFKPLGEAIGGAISDFTGWFTAPDAAKDVKNMGGPKNGEIPGEGKPVEKAAKIAGGNKGSDLCHCICECFARYLGKDSSLVKTAEEASADATDTGASKDLESAGVSAEKLAGSSAQAAGGLAQFNGALLQGVGGAVGFTGKLISAIPYVGIVGKGMQSLGSGIGSVGKTVGGFGKTIGGIGKTVSGFGKAAKEEIKGRKRKHAADDDSMQKAKENASWEEKYHNMLQNNEKKRIQSENMARRGDNWNESAKKIGTKIGNVLESEKPVQGLLQTIGEGTSRLTNTVITTPFALLGGIIEHSTIPILSSLGPIISFFGQALGGLASGMVDLVLKPMIEQISTFGDQLQAMFTTTGATFATPTVDMGGPPPPGTGKDWNIIAKRAVEFSQQMDSASITAEKFKVTWMDVKETGADFAVIQKKMMDNFKKGIRDTKTLNVVTKVGLQTASAIGSSAEMTAELFADWHQKLGMNNADLYGMQRNMKDIAMSTGLFGDQLIEVARTSGKILSDMRMTGTLTTGAAKDVMELTARGKKTGTEQTTDRLLNVLSKGTIGSGDEQMNKLVKVAASMTNNMDLIMRAFKGGDILGDSKALRELTKGMETRFLQLAKDITPRNAGVQQAKTYQEALDAMSLQEKSFLSNFTKQEYGEGAEALNISLKNLVETSKSFDERLSDLNKSTVNAKVRAMSVDEIQKKLSATPEVLAKFNEKMKEYSGDVGKSIEDTMKLATFPRELRSEFRGQLTVQQAEFQKQQLMISTSSNLFDALNKTLDKGTKGLNGSFTEVVSGNENFAQYLKSIGVKNLKNGGQAIEMAMNDQAKILRKRAKDLGDENLLDEILPSPKEMANALAKAQKGGKGSADALKGLVERFAQAQGILGEKGKEAADPMYELKKDIMVIKGYLLEMVTKYVHELYPMIKGFIDWIKEAPFWKAFQAGDYKKAFEELGKWLEELPAKWIDGVGAQFAALDINKVGGFSKFTASVTDVFFAFLKPLFQGAGAKIREWAPDLAAFFDQVKEIKWEEVAKKVREFAKSINDFFESQTWKDIKEVLGVIGDGIVWVVKGLKDLHEMIGTKGMIAIAIVGLIALFVGPGALIGAIGSVAGALAGPLGLIAVLVAGAIALKGAKDKVDNMLKEHGDEVEKITATKQTEAKQFKEGNKDKVKDMSDQDLKKQQEELAKETRRLSDVMNQMSKELSDNLNSASGAIAEASGFGSADEIAERARKDMNEVVKQQAAIREKQQFLQAELMRRATEGKDPEELAKEAAMHKAKADSAQEQMNKINNLIGQASGRQGKNVDHMLDEHLSEVAGLLGMSEKDAKKWVKDQYTGWANAEDDERIRVAFTRKVKERQGYDTISTESKSERQTQFASEKALQESLEATKKAKKEALMTQFGGVAKDDESKRLLENYINRYLEVQVSGTKQLKEGDLASLGKFQPGELKDPAKFKQWQEEMQKFNDKLKLLTGTSVDLNKANEDLVTANAKRIVNDKAIADEAMKVWTDSKVTKNAKSDLYAKSYKTTLGTSINANDPKKAQEEADKIGEKIYDRAVMKKMLADKGFFTSENIVQDGKVVGVKDKEESKYTSSDYQDIATKYSKNITDAQVAGYDVTKKLLEEADPEKAKKMYDVLWKQLSSKISLEKMSFEDYETAITQLATLKKSGEMIDQKIVAKAAERAKDEEAARKVAEEAAKAGRKLTDEATKKTSIYTHDTHLEKLMMPMAKNLEALVGDVTEPAAMDMGMDDWFDDIGDMFDEEPEWIDNFDDPDWINIFQSPKWMDQLFGATPEWMDWFAKKEPDWMESFDRPKWFDLLDNKTFMNMTGICKDDFDSIRPIIDETMAAISAKLPHMDVEDEIRRKKAEGLIGQSQDMSNVEDNTENTAKNTAKMVSMFSAFIRAISQRISAATGGVLDIGMEEELTPFYEEILSTEWAGGDFNDTPTIEFSSTQTF
jgi:hypothetical protein